MICKTIDPDGVVSYTEAPLADCPTPLKLPPDNRYQPQVPASSETGRQPGLDNQSSLYQSVAIAQPQHQSALWNNQGQLSVVLTLSPVLQSGHRVRLFLDGVAIDPDFASEAATLSNVSRGTHTLSAAIIDQQDQLLLKSPTITFTLHRSSRFSPTR